MNTEERVSIAEAFQRFNRALQGHDPHSTRWWFESARVSLNRSQRRRAHRRRRYRFTTFLMFVTTLALIFILWQVAA